MTIQNFTMPFPDFKNGEIINPDQFDANNSAIATKFNEILGFPGINGMAKQLTDFDLNNLDITGFYWCYGNTLHSPFNPSGASTSWMYVVNIKLADDARRQILYMYNDVHMYVRYQLGGTWYGWVCVTKSETPVDIGLSNGWTFNDGNRGNLRTESDGRGNVRLCGSIGGGNIASWTNVGYVFYNHRPAFSEEFVVSGIANGAQTMLTVRVDPDSNIKLTQFVPSGLTEIHFSGCNWRIIGW
jgi:hypothetical protein